MTNWEQDVAAYKSVLNDGSILTYLPLLVEPLSDRPDKEAFREFTEAGGLDAITDTIEWIATHDTDLATLECVVDLLLMYTIHKVNAFDDTIGTIPLLVYFLCERDKYSVDISWTYAQATRCPAFLKSFLSLLMKCVEKKELVQPIMTVAQNILHFYPPMRCTPLMFSTLGHPDMVSNMIKSLHDVMTDCSYYTCSQVASILTGIVGLGLGVGFHRVAATCPGLYCMRVHFTKGVRCSCEFCDLLRRTHKAVRDRDEMGIPASVPYAIAMRDQWNKKAAISIIEKILDVIIQKMKEQNILGDELIIIDRTLHNVCVSLFILSPVDPLTETLHNKLADAIILNHTQSPHASDIKLGWKGPGVRSAISLLSSWMIGRLTADPDLATRTDEPQYLSLLMESSHDLLKVLKSEAGRDFPVEAYNWLAPFSLLLFLKFLLQRRLRDPEIDPKMITVDSYVCQWDEDQYALYLETVAGWAEKYMVNRGDSNDSYASKEQFGSLLVSVCIMCEGLDWFHVAEARRRVLPMPPAMSGTLLHSIRQMSNELYGELFAEGGGCVHIRNLLNVSLIRSEAASAITTPLQSEWQHLDGPQLKEVDDFIEISTDRSLL